LTRERQIEDERIVRVALTQEGQAQIDALRQKKREALAQWLDVLEQSEQAELQRMIEQLIESAEAQGLGDE
jgi:DNA-binding MarR family transcriptional regulator